MAMAAEKPIGGTGLAHLWSKLTTWVKAGFAAKSHMHDIATASADGFMSKTDKAKLDDFAYIIGVDTDGPYLTKL